MPVNIEAYQQIKTYCDSKKVTLVAVSKTKPMADLMALYELGQRDFGENYVQELLEKQEVLPKDIRWHFIGHLQGNKVKLIVPFVHLIHGVDSEKLLMEVDRQGQKINRVIDCLLQVFIAKEETKFGMDEAEARNVQIGDYANVQVLGLMGMASNTKDETVVKSEFEHLHEIFKTTHIPHLTSNILSMGMSSDYKIAIDAGSNMVRIGSLLFGERNYGAK